MGILAVIGRRVLTIFFSDLEGFSSFSEKRLPEELTKLLNDYLTDMTDIIMEEGGTLDQYVGDAIVAFWNAPLPEHRAGGGRQHGLRPPIRLHHARRRRQSGLAHHAPQRTDDELDELNAALRTRLLTAQYVRAGPVATLPL